MGELLDDKQKDCARAKLKSETFFIKSSYREFISLDINYLTGRIYRKKLKQKLKQLTLL